MAALPPRESRRIGGLAAETKPPVRRAAPPAEREAAFNGGWRRAERRQPNRSYGLRLRLFRNTLLHTKAEPACRPAGARSNPSRLLRRKATVVSSFASAETAALETPVKT